MVQDAQFLRAVAAQPLARGNAVNVLQFSVTRQHATVADAAAFVLTAFSSLPTSGTATIICGASGENVADVHVLRGAGGDAEVHVFRHAVGH